MKIEFTEEEIWECWSEIIEHPDQACIGSIVVIRKVLESALKKNV